MKKKIWRGFLVLIFVFVFFLLIVCHYFHLFPKKYYLGEDFGIERIYSEIDYDQDGIDDYYDMLLGAREFVEKKPIYKSAYYEEGYPPSGEGVCTDVVAASFLHAGYDLRELVNQDIKENRDEYPNIKVIDKNIDYRRVQNL